MTPEKAKEVLPIYEANLARYEAEGDSVKVTVQKNLIARLKADIKRGAQ